VINDSEPVGANPPDKVPGPEPPLVEGEDFYVENGLYVFTAKFLLRRGYCCGSGCRHCPYPKES
jgi:hypothetical protein